MTAITVSNTNKQDKPETSKHRIYTCEICGSECFLVITADNSPTSCPFNGDMQPVWEELDVLDPEDEQ